MAAWWDILLDWGTKLGLGGLVVWVWKTFVEDNATRGQRLVDEGRPELRAVSNSGGGQTAIALDLENTGRDVAQNVTVGFTGIVHVRASTREIRRGATVRMAALNVATAPLFTRDVETAEIEVRYEDRYGTPSTLTIPVSRQRRDDGGYNMNIQWGEAKTRHTKPSWRARVKIGREH